MPRRRPLPPHPRQPEIGIDAVPPKLVEMGRISAPFGIKGWIRVQTYTRAIHGSNSLASYPVWWISGDGGWREVKVEQSQAQGADVVAKLAGMDDRDVAAALKGQQVAVAREALPPAAKGEFYWADLVGLRVRNTEGLDLGVVTSMMETGANDVMVVQQSAVDGDKQAMKEQERLIPFIADVIKRVDIAASLIEVEWGADY
jgi:16S rRNA processing protein RimM